MRVIQLVEFKGLSRHRLGGDDLRSGAVCSNALGMGNGKSTGTNRFALEGMDRRYFDPRANGPAVSEY